MKVALMNECRLTTVQDWHQGIPPYSLPFQMFFRKLPAFRRLIASCNNSDLLPFHDFVHLLRLMLERKRGFMESHVQPQVRGEEGRGGEADM